MRRAGWDARRRNRRIGTADQGWGADNRMVVPEAWHGLRPAPERFGPHQVVERTIAGASRTFLIQATRPGTDHPCTVEDVAHLLAHVPADDLRGLTLFVLRQPTRKHELLRPVWGRLVFEQAIGRHVGPAVELESLATPATLLFGRGRGVYDARRLERLVADGHGVERDRHGQVRVAVTRESARATQLHWTLLHEIGHWVDWRRHVVPLPPQPSEADEQRWWAATGRYWRRPWREREEAADRYAARLRSRLHDDGVIPFAPRDATAQA